MHKFANICRIGDLQSGVNLHCGLQDYKTVFSRIGRKQNFGEINCFNRLDTWEYRDRMLFRNKETQILDCTGS